MSNELTVKTALPVKTMAELETVGQMFERSGMFGCSQQGQGMVLAMTCVMEGKTLLQVLETYHLIDGRPSMRADAMLANLLQLGGSYRVIKRTENGAKAEFRYKEAVYVSEYSWEEAQAEPYIFEKDGKTFKKNWRTPRARMQSLWARVISDGVRVVCPLANRGNYTPEEVSDTVESSDQRPQVADYDPPVIIPKVETPASVVQVPEKKEEVVPVLVAEEVDPTIIPLGTKKGEPWEVLDVEALEKCLTSKIKKITDEHRAVIKKVIAEKQVVVNG